MKLKTKRLPQTAPDLPPLPPRSTRSRNSAPSTPPQPPAKPPGRSVMVVEQPQLPELVHGCGREYIESPLKKILMGLNARAMSPREMQVLSEDLYAAGILTWEEYSELAFQAELHPDFTRTIGALTGEPPMPDRPKDFVKEWEARLDFERRYFPERPERDRALRILSVLRRINAPTGMRA